MSKLRVKIYVLCYKISYGSYSGIFLAISSYFTLDFLAPQPTIAKKSPKLFIFGV